MRLVMPVAFICLALAISSFADEDTEQRQVVAARRILDGWHDDQPQRKERFVHVVCWTPADRALPAEYSARLTRIMEHIQRFYAREMERLGFGARSFNLSYDSDEKLVMHIVRGHREAAHYAVQSGNEIRKECLPVLEDAGIDAESETILIFCNLATWNDRELSFTHKSPYYAGGSFRRGAAWQLDSPELDSLNLLLTKPMIRDGQYGHISLGKHNSIFIGGIAHELGHALGLPHCKARPDEAFRGTALMGSGNRTYGDELRGEGRGSFLTLAHAMRLASHPQFSGSIKGINADAEAAIDGLSVTTDGKAIQVSGTVTGTPPVYAVVAYFDPVGGNDYDSTTATAVPSQNGRFTLSSDALPPGKQGELRVFPLHVNGSAAGQMSRTKFQYPYQVADDGTPDLSLIQVRLELSVVVAALARGDREQALSLAGRLRSDKAIAIARHLTSNSRPSQTPAGFDGTEMRVALTALKADSATVGWFRPTFNRVPESTLLIESDGEIFETGIYAHAPARHVYQLDGKWQSLAGQVGLASGHGGTVQFKIRGDGELLWKSKIVSTGKGEYFDVRLAGVHKLELVTDPTQDGPGSDWGLWLAPMLKRK
jgi:hypothetical protein